MNDYKYKIITDVALNIYKENGMTFEAQWGAVNGVLIVQAPDEETADKIRMTFTDIRMWEKIA
jgi:hypothetical protein